MPIRARAFLIHLAASCGLALLALAPVLLIWYPLPLSKALGLARIFFILFAILFILGPLLTLVVSNPAKKSLRFDLTVIVLLQLVAFGYGLMTIAEGRPAWYVFNKDRFDLVQAVDVDNPHAANASADYRSAPWFGPRWVASVAPKDIEKAEALMMESITGGADLPQRIDLYVPIENETSAIQAKANELAELARYNPQADVDDVLKRHPKANAWLPLMARITPMTVLLDKTDGSVVAVVDLRPWE